MNFLDFLIIVFLAYFRNLTREIDFYAESKRLNWIIAFLLNRIMVLLFFLIKFGLSLSLEIQNKGKFSYQQIIMSGFS
jgi:hypothetical protein